MSSSHTDIVLGVLEPVSLSNEQQIPRLPPPASVRSHQRSRTAVDLLSYSRSSSSSPERPSVITPLNARSSTYLPFLNISRPSSPSKVTPIDAAEYGLTSRSQSPNKSRPAGKVERITSWFEGASEPVNIGLVASSPKNEEIEPFYKADIVEDMFSTSHESADIFTRRPTKKPTPPPSANSSRFSLFRKASSQQIQSDATGVVNLNIHDALFPDGLCHEKSPKAYDTLQGNAEGALRQFQGALVENSKLLRKVRSEKNVQADELEASQTRNEHLKMQLLEMAERAAEHEKLIETLRSELKEIKSHHQTHQSIRIIDDGEDQISVFRAVSDSRRSRTSNASTLAESVSESEMSSAVSVFSDVADSLRSPGTSIGHPSPIMRCARTAMPNVEIPRTKLPQSTPILTAECQQCHGVKAPEAWGVVETLKLENEGLKERVAQLQCAQDDALDSIIGMLKMA